MTQNHHPIFMIRPKAGAEDTVKSITARLGWVPNVVYCPLIEVHDLKTELPKGMVEPLVFTSSNAVKIAAMQTPMRGNVICVGRKVANLARKNGFDVLSIFETAQEMIEQGLPPTFTYLHGEPVSIDLALHGGKSHVLYVQKPLELSDMALAKMQFGGVIPIYSENAADRLMDALQGIKTKMVAICISQKVAKRLDSSLFARILIVDSPTSDEMVHHIIKEI